MLQLAVETRTVEWVGALATVAAVVLALALALGQAVSARRRRPQLSLAFDPGSELDFIRGVGLGSGGESHWLRLRVRNKRGKRSADDVEVLLVSVAGGPAHSIVHATPLDVTPLRWSTTTDRDCRPLTRLTVPPGLERHVDLLALREPDEMFSPKPGQTSAIAVLQVWPEPADRRHWLGGKDCYVITLAVAARDADARFYELRLDWDGLWWDAIGIREHLVVRSLKETPRGRR